MAYADSLYQAILDSMSDGVYFVNRERKITYWNKGAERIAGYSAQETLGMCCADNLLMHVTDDGVCLCREGCPLVDTITTGEAREAEVYLHHKDGHRVPVSVRATPFRDSEGVIVGAVEVFNDNSAKLAALKRIEELEEIALVCPLTEVANRRHTEIVIEEKVNEMGRYGWPFGLLFADIDEFKRFNDTYGHGVGDLVLKMVAKSLSGGVRSFDLVGRWGGEEFVVVFANTDAATLNTAAERCRMLVEKSQFHHGDQELRVTISIGATLARQGDTLDTLVKRADGLMYCSKRTGRNRVTTD